MGLLLYRILVALAEGLLRPFSLFHRRAAALLRIRKEGIQALRQVQIPEGAEVWWVHCASLGEFEQARPVMQELKKQRKNVFIALSFFSPSGYFPARNTQDADFVFALPADRPVCNRLVMQALKPAAAIWVKYDFWFGYLNALNRANVPLFVIAAVFSKQHFLFRFPGKLLLPVLKQSRCIFTQDAQSLLELQEQGFTQVQHAGDTRFDRVLQLNKYAEPVPMAQVFRQESLLVIAGSSWPAEEALLRTFIDRYGMVGWKLILVPHDVSEAHIKDLQDRFHSLGVRLWSEFTEADSGVHILIVDSIGLLSRLYRHAHIAVVGGGYRGALHNILEAAVYGMPVVFGPQTHKYWEAQVAVAAGWGFQPKDQEQFDETMQELLYSEERRNAATRASAACVQQHAGATEIILHTLNMLPDSAYASV
jgi:3-deoxy-D-manno-octulosonic-acid transferase